MKKGLWIVIAVILMITAIYAYQSGFFYTVKVRSTLLMQSGSTLDVDGSADFSNGLTLSSGSLTLSSGDLTTSGDITVGDSLTVTDLILASTDGGKVFKAGSYSSKVTLASGATTEMVTVAGQGEEDDFYIGYGAYIATTGENGRGFGLATLVEAKNTTGTSTIQGGQMMAFLGTVGGTEAAHLKTAGGDPTAGMYGLWLKNGANPNCVLDSGSKVANLWLDNSISGTDNGAEFYSMYITQGGLTPDAVFGMESGNNGWSALFYFDETCYNKDPISSSTTDNTANDSDGTIKINLNGTTYYIPYFGAGKLN